MLSSQVVSNLRIAYTETSSPHIHKIYIHSLRSLMDHYDYDNFGPSAFRSSQSMGHTQKSTPQVRIQVQHQVDHLLLIYERYLPAKQLLRCRKSAKNIYSLKLGYIFQIICNILSNLMYSNIWLLTSIFILSYSTCTHDNDCQYTMRRYAKFSMIILANVNLRKNGYNLCTFKLMQ